MQRYMERFKTFKEYARTQINYDELIEEINSSCNKIEEEIEVEFTSNINVRKKNLFYIPQFPRGWEEIFEKNRDKIQHSMDFVNYQIEKNGCSVFPENENLFRAFCMEPTQVKIIILGQDPYHSREKKTGKCVSNGMAFSCYGQIQPSLRNVFKELKRTYGKEPKSGNLDFWAEQGVLLLNTCLTVNEGKPKSHGNAWKQTVISILDDFFELKRKVIVCLWGAVAKEFFKNVSYNKNSVLVLEAGHPSGLNTSNPFVGCDHFRIIDEIFERSGKQKIDWVGW